MVANSQPRYLENTLLRSWNRCEAERHAPPTIVQAIETQRGRRAKAQIRLDLLEVRRPRFNPLTIGMDSLGRDAQLSRGIHDHRPRGRAEVIGGESQVAQHLELERKAQAGMRLARPVDGVPIVL
jgi:hypothetical protein